MLLLCILDQGVLEASNADGSNRIVLVNDNVDRPRAVIVHPLKRYNILPIRDKTFNYQSLQRTLFICCYESVLCVALSS